MDYRHSAKQHLKFANENLALNKDESLKYAALELRMTMEAITYDKVNAYADEFPPEEYETWQPRKLMAVLLEIDPMADKDNSISIGKEEKFGVPAPHMTALGTERVLSLRVLKKHYDALGSYLHTQSLKNARSGKKIDHQKLRQRCEEISKFLSDVLSSSIFNTTLGIFSSIKCAKCGNLIRKRLAQGKNSNLVECSECDASYTAKEEGKTNAKWTPQTREISCANRDCEHKIEMWCNEVAIGKSWKCSNCHGTNAFTLCIGFKKDG